MFFDSTLPYEQALCNEQLESALLLNKAGVAVSENLPLDKVLAERQSTDLFM
jgi:hypothetical protein